MVRCARCLCEVTVVLATGSCECQLGQCWQCLSVWSGVRQLALPPVQLFVCHLTGSGDALSLPCPVSSLLVGLESDSDFVMTFCYIFALFVVSNHPLKLCYGNAEEVSRGH